MASFSANNCSICYHVNQGHLLSPASSHNKTFITTPRLRMSSEEAEEKVCDLRTNNAESQEKINETEASHGRGELVKDDAKKGVQRVTHWEKKREREALILEYQLRHESTSPSKEGSRTKSSTPSDSLTSHQGCPSPEDTDESSVSSDSGPNNEFQMYFPDNWAPLACENCLSRQGGMLCSYHAQQEGWGFSPVFPMNSSWAPLSCHDCLSLQDAMICPYHAQQEGWGFGPMFPPHDSDRLFGQEVDPKGPSCGNVRSVEPKDRAKPWNWV